MRATSSVRSPPRGWTTGSIKRRGTGVGQLLTGFLVDQAHRQANLAARIDLEQLDLDLLAFAQDVADVLDPLVFDLRDVHQPILAGHEGHEGSEIDDAGDLSGVD